MISTLISVNNIKQTFFRIREFELNVIYKTHNLNDNYFIIKVDFGYIHISPNGTPYILNPNTIDKNYGSQDFVKFNDTLNLNWRNY